MFFILTLIVSSFALTTYYFFFFYEFSKSSDAVSIDKPGISVVVAAHNELANLRKLIPALKSQNYPEFEIIVVNDRSADGTREFLALQNVKHLNVLETPIGLSNKKFALTQAISLSNKQIIVLTDADCIPVSNDWLSKVAEAFLPEIEVVLGYSPYCKTHGLLNELIRFDTFLGATLYFSATLSGNPYMGVGRNIAYRKTLFQKIGFDKHLHLVGGDDDLFVRDSSNGRNVGIKLGNNANTISNPKTTYRDWIRQKRRHQTIGMYYNLLAKMYLGIFQGATVLFYISLFFSIFLDKHTLLIIIIFILRTLGLVLIQRLVSQKLEDKFTWFMVPILDLLCVGINTIVGFTVLIRKKVTWK